MSRIWNPDTVGKKCDVQEGPCNCGAWHTVVRIAQGAGMPPQELVERVCAAVDETKDAAALPFSREQLFLLHKELTARGLELMQKKNADYSHVGPFQNFTACEAYGITTEDGLITRMSDKLSRLASIFRKGAQVTESEEDALTDLINYAVCLAGIRRSKNADK